MPHLRSRSSPGRSRFCKLLHHCYLFFIKVDLKIIELRHIGISAAVHNDRDIVSPIVSDSELRETQTANYFSNLYPIDCAVAAVNA